jgi:Alternative complex III, ActD subunit
LKRKATYGLLAEFERPEQVLRDAEQARREGYRSMDAFTPMPVEGLAEAVGFEKTRLPLVVLIGGIFGMCFGFALQYYASVISFPLNIDGKPHNSWPSFIPITFEMTILAAALAATFGMFAMNGLPTPYHPLFNVPRFALATRSRFFLVIKKKDGKFDPVATRSFLEGLKPYAVYEVEV